MTIYKWFQQGRLVRLQWPRKALWTTAVVFIFFQGLLSRAPMTPDKDIFVTLDYLHLPPSTPKGFRDEFKNIVVSRSQLSTGNAHYRTSVEMGIHKYPSSNTSKTSVEKGVKENVKENLEELLDIFSRETCACKKFLRLGGYSCKYQPEGEKHVCLDPWLNLSDYYCLVYSIGVGHDFSFDVMMGKFGCDVYAFDSDRYHANYPTHITDRVTFYKVRLGTEYLRETAYRTDEPEGEGFLLEYWPLPGIMRRLGHRHNNLHYLKMDIEGNEWKIFQDSIFKTKILEGTQQLALEVHLEDLKLVNGTQQHSEEELLKAVKRYLRVARGLTARGFRLAHWEPNSKSPETTTVAGVTFHVYFETLWINQRYQIRRNKPSKFQPPEHL